MTVGWWKCPWALTGRRMKKKVTPPTSGASPISGSKMTLSIPWSWKIQESFTGLVNTYSDDDDKGNAENTEKWDAHLKSFDASSDWLLHHSVDVHVAVITAKWTELVRGKWLQGKTTCTPARLLLRVYSELRTEGTKTHLTPNDKTANQPYIQVQNHLPLIHLMCECFHSSDPERLELGKHFKGNLFNHL